MHFLGAALNHRNLTPFAKGATVGSVVSYADKFQAEVCSPPAPELPLPACGPSARARAPSRPRPGAAGVPGGAPRAAPGRWVAREAAALHRRARHDAGRLPRRPDPLLPGRASPQPGILHLCALAHPAPAAPQLARSRGQRAPLRAVVQAAPGRGAVPKGHAGGRGASGQPEELACNARDAGARKGKHGWPARVRPGQARPGCLGPD
jgi:hypothetical protein